MQGLQLLVATQLAAGDAVRIGCDRRGRCFRGGRRKRPRRCGLGALVGRDRRLRGGAARHRLRALVRVVGLAVGLLLLVVGLLLLARHRLLVLLAAGLLARGHHLDLHAVRVGQLVGGAVLALRRRIVRQGDARAAAEASDRTQQHLAHQYLRWCQSDGSAFSSVTTLIGCLGIYDELFSILLPCRRCKLSLRTASVYVMIYRMTTYFRYIFSLLIVGVYSLLSVVAVSAAPQQANLPVPYTSQAPTGSWAHQWWEACEEGSATMVAYYYSGTKKIATSQAVATMRRMFNWEEKTFGSSDNSDAEQTADFIRHTTLVNTEVVHSPTPNDIKAEIDKGHPVLVLLNRYQLYPDLQSGAPGTSYHIMVIRGYDDTKNVFILNDPARPHSAPTVRYSYDAVLAASHDFNATTGEADGPATVIFTSAKKGI